MTQTVTEINKIFTDYTLDITKVKLTTLAFNDGKAIMKPKYSVTAGYINVIDQIENFLAFYMCQDSCDYYEFKLDLRQPNTIISGYDTYQNILTGLIDKAILMFINGYLVNPASFEIVNDSSIILHYAYQEKEISDIIIVASKDIEYKGLVTSDPSWNSFDNSMILADYDKSRYIFFKNDRLVNSNAISKNNETISLNFIIDSATDTVEYYKLPSTMQDWIFEEAYGYYTYGPTDIYGNSIPLLYDTVCTFPKIARLAINSIRKGMFIREEGTDGCVMIVDDNFETYNLKCMQIYPFTNTTLESNQWYIQVPSARSILQYVSQFDLNCTLLPELLTGLQTVVLDEAYDEIQRLKNIRSLYNVDSTEINNALKFMGLDYKINNYELEKRHLLLEELDSFYNIVGTKASYNQYNLLANNSHIVKLEQLFTPIEDDNTATDIIQRYVTFRTAEELGAEYKKEYVFPMTDYGYVGALANDEDVLTNTPTYEGLLENTDHGDYSQTPSQNHNSKGIYRPYSPFNYREVTIITEEELDPSDTTTPYVTLNRRRYKVNIEKRIPMMVNDYINNPQSGPNKPTLDYGYITDEVENYYDYGLVSDAIKGKWVEWFEWDRPHNWYPTNHCNVSVEVPPDVDYDTFMEEFKNTFYNIASTVLYIHDIIEVYSFGGNSGNSSSSGSNNSGMKMDLVRAPIYTTSDYTFTTKPTNTNYN